MLLKILSKIILRNFFVEVTNLVLSFCFVTKLFNHTISNKKQTPLELSFLADTSALNSTKSCRKKEYRIFVSQDDLVLAQAVERKSHFIQKA